LEYLGFNNKPKPEVHPGHKLMGPKEEEEEEESTTFPVVIFNETQQLLNNIM
jgi:hypothetical protein